MTFPSFSSRLSVLMFYEYSSEIELQEITSSLISQSVVSDPKLDLDVPIFTEFTHKTNESFTI